MGVVKRERKRKGEVEKSKLKRKSELEPELGFGFGKILKWTRAPTPANNFLTVSDSGSPGKSSVSGL